eukprot:IDg19211t1
MQLSQLNPLLPGCCNLVTLSAFAPHLNDLHVIPSICIANLLIHRNRHQSPTSFVLLFVARPLLNRSASFSACKSSFASSMYDSRSSSSPIFLPPSYMLL